jgi:hypothetical protein
MKRENVFLSCIVFLLFCVFLFYANIEIRRLIALRVESALELSRTASGYLRAMQSVSAYGVESKGLLIFENENGRK